MLKLNTVLTALAVVLLGLLSWLGAQMWGDISQTKSSVLTLSAHIEEQGKHLDDHETRIRETEKRIIVLQYRTGQSPQKPDRP
jgi:hypothetical protein